jgi:3D (Asp-Asp-Asp) domain-containing protein
MLVVALSTIGFMALIMAIIPAGAIMPSDFFDFRKYYTDGVHTVKSEMKVAYNESLPCNADGERLRYVGDFKVTHYCACTICTYGSGITASGKPVAEGMIAADWGVLPRGTKVYIKRGETLLEMVVEDRGGAINGNIIDVYVSSHERALGLGVYTAELYVDPGTDLT